MVTREGIIAVYLVASGKHGTLYIGVTIDLSRRAWEHRESLIDGFTKTYRCTRLVWWEAHDLITEAIAREKRLKAWRRDWKVELIERIIRIGTIVRPLVTIRSKRKEGEASGCPAAAPSRQAR